MRRIVLRGRRPILFFLATAAHLSVVRGQSGVAPPVPPLASILQRPVPLRDGIGRANQRVTTSSAEAQAFYDQGLAYLHSYVWIEAARSFHQALRLDPNLAMAYLGLTDTYIGLHDVTTAHAAFQRAKELGQRASERERTWITIRERELAYLEDSGSPDTYVEYRQALKDRSEEHTSELQSQSK